MRPERGPGPLSGEKSEKSRPESLDLGNMEHIQGLSRIWDGLKG